MLHLPDDAAIIEARLADCVRAYDVILMSGGVSMGKFDYVPEALEKLHVKKLFHKVAATPRKTLLVRSAYQWGPGLCLSGQSCLYLPVLLPVFSALAEGFVGHQQSSSLCDLNEDFIFRPPLQYFLQVRLDIDPRGSCWPRLSRGMDRVILRIYRRQMLSWNCHGTGRIQERRSVSRVGLQANDVGALAGRGRSERRGDG